MQPHEAFYVQAAALDAMPNDVKFEHGFLLIAETGFTPTDTKVAVGAWYYTKPVADLMTAAPSHNAGGYVVAERRVFAEPGTEDQGVSVFARAGVAAPDVNQFDYSWSAGLAYTGLIPLRDAGNLGLAVAHAHNGDSFRMATAATAPVGPSETQFELTYQDEIVSGLLVQLNSQYVIHPGADPDVANAVVMGTRVTGKF
ncbi:MAG: carbohydrate porin [Proteobacteria bacterium]|nr:carbohydrate porin [Pseudomonadota bacterium]